VNLSLGHFGHVCVVSCRQKPCWRHICMGTDVSAAASAENEQVQTAYSRKVQPDSRANTCREVPLRPPAAGGRRQADSPPTATGRTCTRTTGPAFCKMTSEAALARVPSPSPWRSATGRQHSTIAKASAAGLAIGDDRRGIGKKQNSRIFGEDRKMAVAPEINLAQCLVVGCSSSKPPTIVLVPCGHLCCCEDCATTVEVPAA